ncbi:MAG: hypothetical protein GQ535_07230 [Rhodobacteraceae bacterium]|nr:hypothetical protein [Paracoccaceae bacterium]
MNYGVGVDVMLGQWFFVGAEHLMRDVSTDNASIIRFGGNIDSATLRAGIKF